MSGTRPRTAVISGGGTGIGRAVAETLLRDGYHVALLGRRNDVLADAAAAMAHLGIVHTHAVDLSDPGMVENRSFESRTISPAVSTSSLQTQVEERRGQVITWPHTMPHGWTPSPVTL